ncbi:hypothetical protein M0R88_00385 [Halorussus gelatinilyticus]|uniref:Uncharacterized protein n=1 Tax=Halorussus gelatinilyticus TaxID=2937524 RepID=A0A8U0IIQ4_9EURY|nr:hypothetical protein [Halorussus gelatinilyticus]UPW00576.1 hypothetical protein M0R88_00385 [Halorussus gelatinilyticus]
MPTDSAESETVVSDSATAPTDSPTSSADSATFAWSHTPAESRLLRGLVALPVGVVLGFALGVVLGAVGLVVLLAVEGNYLLAFATLLAVAFGLSRTAPHLLAHRTTEFAAPFRGLDRRTLAAESVGGLAVLAVGALVLPGHLFPVLVGATVVVPLLVASLFTSEGELDAENRRLAYSGTDVDLSTLVGVRRWSLGGYVVYRLSYAAGAANFATPRTLVVPRRVDSRLRDALEAGVATDAGDPGPKRTAVRLVAVAFGLFLFAFAGVLLTVEPTGTASRGDAVLWYAALVTGVFGAIFVSLGIRGG